jgi:RND superfamily putative drug exporter
MRRPLVAALISGGLLVALAIPALGMQTSLAGTESYSRDIAVVRAYDKIQAEFPSESMPAVVALKADDVTALPVRAAIAKLDARAAAQPELFSGTSSVEVSDNGKVATIALPLVGQGDEEAAEDAVTALRDDIVPATLGHVGGVETAVSGETAGIRDFNDALISHVPYVFGFVMLAAFLLLLVVFRSLVIPIKAILLNLLSVGAAYGVMVLVFQKGLGESLLGFHSNGAIEAWIPAFLFVILFGLSMDYHVFILSRVREAFDSGMDTGDAVAHGVKSTAGTVSSAAIVMVAVFAIFATMADISMKELGVGLSVAVLIDATIIRGVLLPATMKLLGDRNWWLPRGLHWLPKVASEEPVPAPA